MSWSDGYIADVAYTSGVYVEMAPAHLSACALLGGVAAPDPSRPFRYLELGCGTGMGVCLFAAANPHAEFVGVDFNPAHVRFAERLIEAAGLDNVRVVEAGFDEVGVEGAPGTAGWLGRFDYAAAHGVWTWVSREVQLQLVAALDGTLKPGALAYLGYNNMAGWAAALPLQRLIRDHAARTPGDSLAKIRSAVAFALSLREARPRGVDFSRLELQLKGALDAPETAPVGLYAYLAHEYLNAHWRPVFPQDLAEDLAAAKLDYAGSADPLAAMPEVALSRAELQASAAYPDAGGRRILADLLAPTSFRQDVFVRGAAPLSPARREEALAALHMAAVAPMETASLGVEVAGGKLELDEVAYRPVLARLGRGAAAASELLAAVAAAGRRMSAGELVAVLMGSGMAAPLARPLIGPGAAVDAVETGRVRRYNEAMVEALRDQAGLRLALASPLTGGGVRASMAECLAYLARADRHPELDSPELHRLAAAQEPFWRGLAMA